MDDSSLSDALSAGGRRGWVASNYYQWQIGPEIYLTKPRGSVGWCGVGRGGASPVAEDGVGREVKGLSKPSHFAMSLV